MGDMGDPSMNWEHTANICKTVARAGKPIVIITKHWNPMPDVVLEEMTKYNVLINTSISALDSKKEREYRMAQYIRIGVKIKSVLRIVTCDFNKDTHAGRYMNNIQNVLLDNRMVIDTVFRPSKNNELINNGTIKASKVNFMRSSILASAHDDSVYLGLCDTCPEMCGINL
jgi:hypothetical protein